MKFAACLAALFLLFACAPISAPQGPAIATPVIQGNVFVTRDGLSLPVRRWAPDGAPRAIIIGLHGMNDYSNAFDLPAKVWSKDGILTLAYDQRGFGGAPNPGLWAGSDAMRQDFDDFVAAARIRYPGVPLFALGESMGGAVLLTALAEPSPPKLAGAILVSPAVWSRADMPLSYRAALFLVAHLLPGMTMTGSGLHILASDNIPMLRAFSRDPLVIKKTRADAVFGLVNLMDEGRQAPEHLAPNPPPILLLTGKNDQVIPREPTQGVIDALGSRATVKTYDKGYHMLLRDLDGPARAQDVADWVKSGGRPEGSATERSRSF